MSSGQTDRNGVFRTEVATDPQPLIVVGRDGNDITASGLSNEWTAEGWWGWWNTPPAGQRFAVHLYTERPMYRPGQSVYFKAIVRQDNDALLGLPPAGTPVTVRLRDARDNVVRTQELTTNDFGSVTGRFLLAEGAMVGEYALELVVDNEAHRLVFAVEDYRKPDYEVTVQTDAADYISGDSIQVTVDSRYFFGEPVPNADVVLNRFMLGERYWWEGTGGDYVWYQWYGDAFRGKTDAEGRVTITLEAAENEFGQNIDWQSNVKRSTWALEATVDDGSHQTVSGSAIVQVYTAAELLRLDTNGYVHEPGQAFPVVVSASTFDGRPVSGRELELTLRRYNYSNYDYTNVVQSQIVTTGADGTARVPFVVPEPGYYQLSLTGNDPAGRYLEYKTWVYAFSDSFFTWYGRPDALSISAERDSYAPGDTARLLIESSFSGPALLTFERGTTRREQLIELTAPLTLVDAPIRQDDAPNIFVTVNAWLEQDTTLTDSTWSSLADSRLQRATVELEVPVTDKSLTVTIRPAGADDGQSYRPRQDVSFTVRVDQPARRSRFRPRYRWRWWMRPSLAWRKTRPG